MVTRVRPGEQISERPAPTHANGGGPPDVAIVHDYLTQRGGAERVVLSMLKAFPGAPVHTSLYDEEGTFPLFKDAQVTTMALDRIGGLRRNHRWALPFLAPAFARHRVDAEVVLCSSSGWAHGVQTSGRTIVFCHAPARWLYDTSRYLGNGRRIAALALAGLRRPLLAWDARAAAGANRYLANSSVVREEIRRAYGIDADVVHPPHTLDPGGPQEEIPGLEVGFFLCVARLLPYKNVDALVEAFAELPGERLIVVGDGPERRRLESMAGANVTFAGTVSDAQLRWLYGACTALVAASREDYGLTPLEAASFGKPSAVLRGGGFLDTVVENDTGFFFDQAAPAAVSATIRRLLSDPPPAERLRHHAAGFSEEQFIRRLRDIVAEERSRARSTV
jgi:glycosyltransferase involved in cell wall biosynthesis